MKALVLGGCGFIGSHIVDSLLNAGHQVRVVDRAPERFRPPLDGVDYRPSSFSVQSELEKALAGMDIVYHCISTMVPATSNKDPQADVRENLIGTLGLLDAMVKRDVSRIVYLSSGGTVYGMPESLPIPEEHALRPLCSYGVVKVAIENYLWMYQHLYGLEPVIIRPANPYGPRQGHLGIQGVIASFLSAVLDGRSIQVWGDGSVVRDFLDVRDLARLCVLAAEGDKVGVFNAGSGRGRSIAEIIALISTVTDISLQIEHVSDRPFDVKEVVLDISKAEKAFGWHPEVSLEQGIHDYFVWLKSGHACSLDIHHT